MDYVIGPGNPDVYLHSNGRSLDVDMEVRILVVSEDMVILVVTLVKVVMVDMVVLAVILVKMAMVATVQVSSQLLDSICRFT